MFADSPKSDQSDILQKQSGKIIDNMNKQLAGYLLAKKVQHSVVEPDSDRWKDYLGRGSMFDASA